MANLDIIHTKTVPAAVNFGQTKLKLVKSDEAACNRDAKCPKNICFQSI